MKSDDNKNLPKIIENSGLALHKTRSLLSITDKILKSKMLVTEQQIGKFIIKDGIATDTETGLTWLRFAHGQRWGNGTVVGDAEEVIWYEAMTMIIPDTFNQQGYAGYNDWRVPNIDELKTLIDKIKGKEGNYIDADVFPKNNGHWFWSSSPDADYSHSAWCVSFNYGDSGSYGKHHDSNVRLVRSAPIPPDYDEDWFENTEPPDWFDEDWFENTEPPDWFDTEYEVIQSPLAPKIIKPQLKKFFSPQKPTQIIPPPQQKIGKFIVQDGIATDTETGLTWLRFAHGQRWENGTVVGDAKEVNWHDAMTIPDTFNQQGYAGYNDWRVPNIDELQTLIDKIKGKKGNYIDADVFPANNGDGFWSSSPDAGDSSSAWVVYFGNGNSYVNYKDDYNDVRLVR